MYVMTDTLADNVAKLLAGQEGDDFTGCCIYAFSGVQPTTNAGLTAALSSPLIKFEAAVADEGGTKQLHWAIQVAGSRQLARDLTQAAQGTGLIAGAMAWLCLCKLTDDLGASSTAFRYAMSIGTSGTDVIVADTSIVVGQTYPLFNVIFTIDNPS